MNEKPSNQADNPASQEKQRRLFFIAACILLLAGTLFVCRNRIHNAITDGPHFNEIKTVAQFQDVMRQDQQIILLQHAWSLTDVVFLKDLKRQLAWDNSPQIAPKLEGFSINILRPNHVPGIGIELERITPLWNAGYALVLLVDNGQTRVGSFSSSQLTEEIRKLKASTRGP